jgi:hypothetical protein
MKKVNHAISAAIAATVVVLIIAISGVSAYFVINKGNNLTPTSSATTSYTVITSCSLNSSGVCPTESTSDTTSSSYSTATNTVSSLLSNGGCSLSNALAFTTGPVRVLSVGVSCSNYNTSINGTMETVRLLHFNMTLQNLSNGNMTANAGFQPSLTFLGISFGPNQGLVHQFYNNPCTVTTALSQVGQNGIATASFPNCFDYYWYYVTGSGSGTVSLSPQVWIGSNLNLATVNATLTVSS